eukprot:UN06102
MGVYSQYSTESYCNIKDEVYKKQCETTILTWTILYLSIGLVFNVAMFIAVLRFYWKIRKINATKNVRRGSVLD